MARITVEDCLEKVDNQYDLVLLAKERTVQLNAGSPMLVEEDNDKKLVVGDWHSLNENLFGENSYIKFGSPEHVSSENIFNIGKELFKNNDYPNFNEVRLEYMREPDVSFSTKSLEGKVNFHD